MPFARPPSDTHTHAPRFPPTPTRPQVGIKVFQGEREMAADNKMLGQFDLVGIPPAPRGVPQVEVIFDIDANGIVNVTAKDKGTGKEQSIAIQSSGGLSDGEIERMVKQAEEYAATDKKRKEFIEAKNDGDSLVYSTEKSLAEHRAKLSAEDISEVEKALAETRAALGDEKQDAEALKAKVQKLQTAAMRIGSAMYKNSGASSSGSSGSDAPPPPPGGDAKDAEFTEKKQ